MSLHFNTFIDNNSDHESNSEFIDNSLQQPYYETSSLQHDEHVQQNDFVPTQHDYDIASAKVSLPKISKRIDSFQNQILKIELEIVIKLQNDQTQQRTQYVQSSTLPKNRITCCLNVDNNHTQFQPDDDLNESFRSNYDN
ncbi:hypothetical protein C1646_765497 [Rhizophagus diaphanus]|nr:hypothetical protein C1646_765497 [Rhizophagus diaphanus] [Rhizophagus sp. MUCL 43196]